MYGDIMKTLMIVGLALAPLCSASIVSSPSRDAASYASQGHVLFVDGDYAKAVRAYQQAVRLAPSTAEYHNNLGKAHGRLADSATIFGERKHLRRARISLRRATELAPERVEYWKDLLEYTRRSPGLLGEGLAEAGSIADRIEELNADAGRQAKRDVFQERADFRTVGDQVGRAFRCPFTLLAGF